MTTPHELPPSEATHATATVTLPKPNDGYRWVLQTEAALPQEPAADPPGYVLVPIEPTREMLEAAWNIGATRAIWSAMLAEAPKREALAAPLDAQRYQWLCNVGQHREIAGTASMSPGRGPFVAMSFPSVYAPAGAVGFGSKKEIDAAIDAAMAQSPSPSEKTP